MSEELKNETLTEENVSEEVSEETVASSETETVENNGMSKSKAKREARKAEVKSEKAKKGFDAILGWFIGIVIAIVVIGAIVMGIVTTSNATVSSNSYSECLTEDGFIQKSNLEKVKDLDLMNIVVPFSEVEYTEEEVDSDINSILESYSAFETDSALTVADGDTINLDYVGSVDGVEFEGGSTGGAGTTLVIGSGSYIDGFEDQLIGSHPGDAVTVNVTFPDPYDGNPDLSGKEAVFECTVNSIKTLPELTDEFVADKCSEYASNVSELREYVKTNGYEGKLMTYLSTYVADNAEAKGIPSSYIKNLKSTTKYTDEQSYAYMSQMYTYMYGFNPYATFEDYTQMTSEEYEADLKTRSNKTAAEALTYEKFFKENGLTVTEDQYNEVLEMAGGETGEETYGKPYLKQIGIRYAVLDYLKDNVTVQ